MQVIDIISKILCTNFNPPYLELQSSDWLEILTCTLGPKLPIAKMWMEIVDVNKSMDACQQGHAVIEIRIVE